MDEGRLRGARTSLRVWSGKLAVVLALAAFANLNFALAQSDPVYQAQDIVQGWARLSADSPLIHYELDGVMVIPALSIDASDPMQDEPRRMFPPRDHEFSYHRVVFFDPAKQRFSIEASTDIFSHVSKSFERYETTTFCDGNFFDVDRGIQTPAKVPTPRYLLNGQRQSVMVDDFMIDSALLAAHGHQMRGMYSFEDINSSDWTSRVNMEVLGLHDSLLGVQTSKSLNGSLLVNSFQCDPAENFRPILITASLDDVPIHEIAIEYQAASPAVYRVQMRRYFLGALVRTAKVRVVGHELGTNVSFADRASPNEGAWCRDLQSQRVYQFVSPAPFAWWLPLACGSFIAMGFTLYLWKRKENAR